MEHIISVMVENKFGALSRVAGLFSGRGFNIDSLSVGPTMDPTVSMMTLVTRGDDRIVEQIIKHLNKLIDVIKVVDLNESEFVARETALIKVHTKPEDRAEARGPPRQETPPRGRAPAPPARSPPTRRALPGTPRAQTARAPPRGPTRSTAQPCRGSRAR